MQSMKWKTKISILTLEEVGKEAETEEEEDLKEEILVEEEKEKGNQDAAEAESVVEDSKEATEVIDPKEQKEVTDLKERIEAKEVKELLIVVHREKKELESREWHVFS